MVDPAAARKSLLGYFKDSVLNCKKSLESPLNTFPTPTELADLAAGDRFVVVYILGWKKSTDVNIQGAVGIIYDFIIVFAQKEKIGDITITRDRLSVDVSGLMKYFDDRKIPYVLLNIEGDLQVEDIEKDMDVVAVSVRGSILGIRPTGINTEYDRRT